MLAIPSHDINKFGFEEEIENMNKGIRDLKKEVATKKMRSRLKEIIKGRNSCREITLMSRRQKDMNDVATPKGYE